MNINDFQSIQQISNFLKEISAPSRIKILLAIGEDEVCVCHLSAKLNMRQAYLSQHLMALRQLGILTTTRDRRFINYRLTNPGFLKVIRNVADFLNVAQDEKQITSSTQVECPCPKCSPSALVDESA